MMGLVAVGAVGGAVVGFFVSASIEQVSSLAGVVVGGAIGATLLAVKVASGGRQ